MICCLYIKIWNHVINLQRSFADLIYQDLICQQASHLQDGLICTPGMNLIEYILFSVYYSPSLIAQCVLLLRFYFPVHCVSVWLSRLDMYCFDNSKAKMSYINDCVLVLDL